MIDFIHIPKNAGSSIEELSYNTSNLEYNGHNTDITKIKNPSLIIIRDPVDRFCSSIRYAFQNYSEEGPLKILKELKLNTPSKWIEILKDPNHKYRKELFNEIRNKSHYIGNFKIDMKWTYSPQTLWIKDPTYVILFENLDEELEYFCKNHNIPYENIHINTTKKIVYILTEEEIRFIHQMYSKDYESYKYYSSLSREQRLSSSPKY
tara:strand:+ start:9677 stop:10297 length:621 start_codon:yes stop_codon:yes gene_type:complete